MLCCWLREKTIMQLQKYTLLIADDEPAIRNGLCRTIDWNKLNIELLGIASDGNQAFELLQKHSPDLVITDIKMPGLTGLDLIEKAKEQKLNTKFIILSGYDDFEFAQRALRSKAECYLLKPVNPQILIEEIQRICTDISSHQKNNYQLQSDLSAAHTAKPILNQRFYSLLSQGEYHSEQEILAASKNLSRPLISCPCCAVMFRFTLSDDKQSAFSTEYRGLFKTALRNVVDELAQEYCQNECFSDYGDDMGFLISPVQRINEFLNKVLATMQTICDISLSVGIGSIAENFLDVALSCRLAQEMAEYHIYDSKRRIFDAKELLLSKKVAPLHPPQNDRLAEAIVAFDESAIEQELGRFFEQIFYIEMPPPQYLKGMCSYLLNDTTKQVSELLQLSAPLPFSAGLSLDQNLTSVSQLFESVKQALLQLAHCCQNSKNFLPDVIIQAQSYIRENVCSRLRVDHVAENVHLSESYFVVLFKKAVGITPHEFIMNCKLEKAKELLLKTEISISEISDMLEYSDYRSFSRAFKKFSGYTPTDYRQMMISTKKKG